MDKILSYPPVEGKTYSLFGNTSSTEGYYRIIRMLADQILDKYPDTLYVINTITRFSSKKSYLRKLVNRPVDAFFMSECINLITKELSQFTLKADRHLRTLSFYKKLLDWRLGTTREQYHLYMLEIELTNRLFASDFKESHKKIALLPYCLQDFSVNCKAAKNEFDYQCKHCSRNCYQNQTSTLLKKYGIEPYIWKGADFKQLARRTAKDGQGLAVFGIACIPELVWGMRKCRKHHIPVLGIPLNGNRCIRWFGEFFPNSVDLNELTCLIKGEEFPVISGIES